MSRLLEQASFLMQVDRIDEAMPLLEQHLVKHPNDLDGLCLLSNAHCLRGSLKTAIVLSRAAIQAHPEEDQGYSSLALALANNWIFSKEAFRAAQTAVRLNPNGVFSLTVLIHIAFHSLRFAIAKQHVLYLLETHPNLAVSHVWMARIQFTRRLWAEAEQCALFALQIEPENTEAQGLLADVYTRLGHHQKAFDLSYQNLRQNPSANDFQERVLQSSEAVVSVAVPKIISRSILLSALFSGPLYLLNAFFWPFFGRKKFRTLPIEVQNFVRFKRKEAYDNDIFSKALTLILRIFLGVFFLCLGWLAVLMLAGYFFKDIDVGPLELTSSLPKIVKNPKRPDLEGLRTRPWLRV